MAFCLDPSGVPRLRDCADAEQFYNQMKPWRTKPYGYGMELARPLGNSDSARKKKHLSIRPVDDGYACRYHNTDVVTYHGDGSLSLDPYASMSTDALVNRLLPDGIHVDYRSGRYRSDKCIVWCMSDQSDGYWWQRPQAGYVIHRETRFARNAEGLYEPQGETDQIAVMQLDRKAAAAVRKANPGLTQFGHWIAAAVAMGALKDKQTQLADIPRRLGEWTLERINDSANWTEVLAMVYRLGIPKEGWGRSHWKGNLNWSPSLMMTALRRTMYSEAGCVETVMVPRYESRNDFERIKKLNRVWG